MSTPNQEAKSRVTQIFQYLRAFYDLRNKAVLQIADQPWTQWLRDIPDHEAVWLAQESDIQAWAGASPDDTQDDNGTDDVPDDSILQPNYGDVLRVRRPVLLQAPIPPDELLEWLDPGWNDPSRSASFIIERPQSYEPSDQPLHGPQSIFFDDDPSRVDAWENWIETRDLWAITETPARLANQIYERVFALHRELEREPETFELMIGDGFLVCNTPTDGTVEHPILLQRVELRFEPQVPEFVVSQADSPPELYEPLLNSIGVRPDVLRQIEQDLSQEDVHPLLGRTTDQFLERSISRLSAQGRFIGNGRPIRSDAGPNIGREPVLFQRRRSGGFARAIENILEDLANAEGFPASLSKLVGDFSNQPRMPGSPTSPNPPGRGQWKSELFLTKPATREQIDIVEFLDKDGHVVVQGPPGTGKTHTTGNILGHLLAQGKRVLVTSHTTKALEEVRDHVVEQLRPLCVSLLGGDARHKDELRQAVDQITSKLTQINAADYKRQVSYLTDTRERHIKELHDVREKLVHAIGSEFRPIVCENQERKPIDAAKYVSQRAVVDGWVPDRPALDQGLPLSTTEIETLYSTNQSVPIGYVADLQGTLADPVKLITPSDFSELSSELLALEQLDYEAWRAYWNQDQPLSKNDQYLAELQDHLGFATKVLRDSPPGSWQEQLLSIGYSGFRSPNGKAESSESSAVFRAWAELIQMVDSLAELKNRAAASFLQHGPNVPQEFLNSDALNNLSEILEHIRSGRRLAGFVLLRHRKWKRLIQRCLVAGHEPRSEEEFTSLRLSVELKIEQDQLTRRWARHIYQETFSAVDISSYQDPIAKAIEFSGEIKNLLYWYCEQWKPFEAKLINGGFDFARLELHVVPANQDGITLLKRFAIDTLPEAITVQRKKVRKDSLVLTLDLIRDLLEESISVNDGGSTNSQLRDSVALRDARKYEHAYTVLRDTYARRGAYSTRTSLLNLLRQAAPKWAEAILNREEVHGAANPPGDPKDAWIWAQLDVEIERRLEESVPGLQDLVRNCEEQLRQVTGELADTKAWLELKGKLTLSQLQALNGWRQLQARIGMGKGIRAPAFRRQARALMPQCQSAVPVWIMPLSTLVETFNPAESKFDYLIVDEASQADVIGLIPWYMAERVLVVGDDQQVTPEDVGVQQQPVDDLINRYLKDIPSSALYDGRASIYELASVAFEKHVRLTDHFRCVEPIIKFSSELSYRGDLECLRDITDASVGPPTVELNVKGLKENDLNEREAVTIASLMIACIEQPEYEGLTFGMISMLGRSRQHQRVQELLMRHLDPKVYEERRIFCGTPPHFQGGERDVIFISIVDSPNQNGGPLPRRWYGARDINKKRYNVAASRAKDQIWVVHSLEPGYDLHGFQEDLRSRLILNARTASTLPSQMERVRQRTRSPFEDEVAKKLLSAGYNVEPAWKVGRLEIDLVIVGEHGRKPAIECDSEKFHPPEKLAEDLARQRILENHGWIFERIRGSAFYRDEESAMRPVFSRLESLGIHPSPAGNIDPSLQNENHLELRQRVEARAREIRNDWDNNRRVRTEQYEAPDEPKRPQSRPPESEYQGSSSARHPVLNNELPQTGGTTELSPAQILSPASNDTPASPTGQADHGPIGKSEQLPLLDASENLAPDAPRVSGAGGRPIRHQTASSPADQDTINSSESPISVDRARELLIRLREQQIMEQFQGAPRESGLLRRSMLETLLNMRPQTAEEFQKNIPQALRLNTDNRQIESYLDIVVSIVRRIRPD